MHAIDVIRRREVFADGVNWPSERRELLAALRVDPTQAQAHSLVGRALLDIGDGHGALDRPTQRAARPMVRGLPSGRLLPDDIGYVELPTLPAAPLSTAARNYARRGESVVGSLQQRGASAWIVDLRLNAGGDIYPMLLAIDSFLNDGPVIGLRDRAGSTAWIRYHHGVLYDRGHRVETAPIAESRALATEPVAMLTGQSTSSSAEGIVVAFRNRPETRTFGQPSAGLATSAGTVTLPDGCLLRMSVARDVDPSGHVYRGPIRPDTTVSTTQPGVDTTIHAAERWIGTRDRQSTSRRTAVDCAIAALLALLATHLTVVGRRRTNRTRPRHREASKGHEG